MDWSPWALAPERACDCGGDRDTLISWGRVTRHVPTGPRPLRGRRPVETVASAELAALHCLDCAATDIYDSGTAFERWDLITSTRAL